MDIFTILQIIIALTFIFFIICLLISEIQEELSALVEYRAKDLRKAIVNFVGKDFANNHLYDNPNSLFSSLNQYTNENLIWTRKSQGPSYLKPQMFAELLLAIIDKPFAFLL